MSAHDFHANWKQSLSVPRLSGRPEFLQPDGIIDLPIQIRPPYLVQFILGRLEGLFEATPFAQFAPPKATDEVRANASIFRARPDGLHQPV